MLLQVASPQVATATPRAASAFAASHHTRRLLARSVSSNKPHHASPLQHIALVSTVLTTEISRRRPRWSPPLRSAHAGPAADAVSTSTSVEPWPCHEPRFGPSRRREPPSPRPRHSTSELLRLEPPPPPWPVPSRHGLTSPSCRSTRLKSPPPQAAACRADLMPPLLQPIAKSPPLPRVGPALPPPWLRSEPPASPRESPRLCAMARRRLRAATASFHLRRGVPRRPAASARHHLPPPHRPAGAPRSRLTVADAPLSRPRRCGLEPSRTRRVAA